MAIIELTDFSLEYHEQAILSQLHLKVNAGEMLVLCGKSGSGKSSLINVFSGLIPELYEAKMQGIGNVFEQPLEKREFSDYVENIGMVFQNPKTQFFTQDVYSELAFPMENAGVAQEEMVKRVQSVANEFNLTRFLEKSMFQLSGGEKQLVAFGSACTLAPKLFLLDEPSSNLDEATIEKLRQYLAWLKNEGFTIIIAEHRLSYLMESADHFLFLPAGIHWTKAELLAKKDSEIAQLGLRSLQPVALQTTTYHSLEPPLLRVENLTYRYPKQAKGLLIPALELAGNEVIGLVGKNGSGKSTLSQLLTGLLKPKQGKISYRGQKISMRRLLKESYIVMQDVNLQLFFETVEKEITAKAPDLTAYDDVVSWLSLDSLLHRHPQTLSGGEKQRVALAAAMLSGKKILVFDEPTSGLDLERMREVSRLIQRLRQADVLILVITHDKEFLKMTCQRMLTMENGEIVADNKIILEEMLEK
ncbi:ABC transporter ATP-binding protein [Enterococcus saccharolyticus]|uniref:ABC transporter domain-containing protein n=1 Tax=Enterococcus saccharolyticus subsp. saccharolyticus ATCC 43076 TaxID=1139996 RepID=S0JCG8_9ENTE|nr:ABC transporter ATP-binding protein [Enterococcus saccharolyticus]EOT30027.1 hypothetical protein OMQ_00719 [Enterococcus saccharolyticus subsp. saccharolyticus ATCC 43076]EOT80573.1 hypothetical protein I572_01100 [Enterococcus saccharolyticus subsp. saccharolyticus ATCC 43076]